MMTILTPSRRVFRRKTRWGMQKRWSKMKAKMPAITWSHCSLAGTTWTRAPHPSGRPVPIVTWSCRQERQKEPKLYIFAHIVGGQSFLRISQCANQPNGAILAVSHFTWGTMFFILYKHIKNILKCGKGVKTITTKSFRLSIPLICCVYT